MILPFLSFPQSAIAKLGKVAGSLTLQGAAKAMESEPDRVRTPLGPVQQPGKGALESEPQQQASRPELSRIAERIHHRPGRSAVGIKPAALQFATELLYSCIPFLSFPFQRGRHVRTSRITYH